MYSPLASLFFNDKERKTSRFYRNISIFASLSIYNVYEK